MSNDKIQLIVKTLSSIDTLINIISSAIADHACLIASSAKKCCNDGCSNIATVKHVDNMEPVCDHCAAATIVNALSKQCEPYWRLASYELWVDIDDAERLRRLQDFVKFLKRNDVLEQPEKDNLH